MKKSILALGLAAALLPGCAAFQKVVVPVLSDVLLVGQDALAILNAIQAAESFFFLAAPNPEAQKTVEMALSDASLALDAALQLAGGAKDLSAEDADNAFAAFRAAYGDLVVLLKRLGVAQPGPAGHLAVRRGSEMKWLQPLALQRKVGE